MSGRRGARVLVVDDDASIRDLLEMALSAEGYDVRTAGDAEQGLAALETHAPRLVLLDWRMPRGGGGTFAARLDTSGLRPRLVVMTAGHDVAEPAAQARADAHLAKPFDLDDLLTLVRRLTT